jgi:hypothetical protein
MPVKIIFDSLEEVPEELRTKAKESDGKYEMDAMGVLNKNRELLDKVAKVKPLQDEVDRLTNKTAELNGKVGELSGELSKAESNKVPSGFVAVSKKDNELITQLKEKNLKPEDVLTAITEVETLRGENKDFKLNQAIGEFASVEKVQNVKALTKLIKQDGVIPLIKEVDENGQKVKKGFLVKQNGEETDEKPYKDYKESNWAEFSHSLDQTAQPPRTGNTLDPPAFGAPTDTEAAKIAQNGQRAATHSAF